MTSDYTKKQVTGDKCKRIYRYVLEDPFGKNPVFMLLEETVVDMGEDGAIVKPVGEMIGMYDSENALHSEIYSKLQELCVELCAKKAAAAETATLP